MENRDLQDSVTMEMLRHDKSIIKWLCCLLAAALVLLIIVFGSIAYVAVNSEFVVDSFGDITNSENFNNSSNIDTYNNYHGDSK